MRTPWNPTFRLYAATGSERHVPTASPGPPATPFRAAAPDSRDSTAHARVFTRSRGAAIIAPSGTQFRAINSIPGQRPDIGEGQQKDAATNETGTHKMWLSCPPLAAPYASRSPYARGFDRCLVSLYQAEPSLQYQDQ